MSCCDSVTDLFKSAYKSVFQTSDQPLVTAIAIIAGTAIAGLPAGLAAGLTCAGYYWITNPSGTNKVQQLAFEKIPDQTRYLVRDATLCNVRQNCGQVPRSDSPGYIGSIPPQPIKNALTKVRLFTSRDSQGTYSPMGAGRRQILLGRFDVLATPCKMDYDHKFNLYNRQNREFYVHHAAAINIGERARAEDFSSYQIDGCLDETKYLNDMEKLFGKILSAQEKTKVKHAVWFPFGMGAFLRNLHRNDLSYQGAKLKQLREKIAERFVRATQNHPNLTIHLCLPEGIVGDETNDNYQAFIKAISQNPKIQAYINADATTLAQDLANRYEKGQVSLCNGANKNLLGNHWFENGAKRAIDENLHRRSSLLSSISFVLNSAKGRFFLSDTVQYFGGQHIHS